MIKRLLTALLLIAPLVVSGFLANKFTPEPDIKEEEEHEGMSGALQSLEFWTIQRAYPNSDIPDGKYEEAFEYSKNTLRKEADNSGTSWTQLGPHNFGGRTISLALNPGNPNTIYAGSASGGLWRSYTGGVGTSAWENIQTGFSVLGVGSIAINPQDTNEMYIGTGEVYGYGMSFGGISVRTTRGSYGIGILKTTDNGATWWKTLDWSPNTMRGVEVVRINPLNPNTVWAGTSEGTYVTFDAGNNWEQVDTTIMVTDLIINPNDTGTVLIACGNLGSTGTGFYRTTNSGANWTKITSGLPASWGGKAIFSIYGSSPNTVFASIGNGAATGAGTWLVKSTNFGLTWSTRTTNDYATYQGWYSHFAVVNQSDSSKVLCAGVDVYKSTNGGFNLSQKSFWYLWDLGRTPIGGPEGPPDYSHADHHCFVTHPSDPNIVYLGNDGGIFRTTDFGETFSGLNGGYQTQQFYNGFNSAETDSMLSIGGLQDNASAIWDGQLAWIRVLGGDGNWAAINYRNTDTMYCTAQYLNLFRSVDGGSNFDNVAPPTGGTGGFVSPFMLAHGNPQLIYSANVLIYKSTNGGNSWLSPNAGVQLDGNNPSLGMSVSPLNDNLVYVSSSPVVSNGKVFRTTNGGTTWQNVTGTLPNRYMIDIAADPVEESVVYVTASGFGTDHLYKSTNYGDTWASVDNNLPDVPTSSVVVDPLNNQHIYLGNDIGVYVTTNGGTNWQEFKVGMPDASIVMDLSISKLNRKLRAATHGSGVWERDLLSPMVGITPISSELDYNLGQNYPNPFNPETKINYSIKKAGNVQIVIYDILGKEVATLVNDFRSPGNYEVTWRGVTNSGIPAASGVYFYTIRSGDFYKVRKMTLVR
ncbi:MAG: T9SS type A sorting domain-containing protein [Ignavibacteriae bacterium]|nr:T9SS type A sorting domain-containing protein [Ignavibacteriota bacterium]